MSKLTIFIKNNNTRKELDDGYTLQQIAEQENIKLTYRFWALW